MPPAGVLTLFVRHGGHAMSEDVAEEAGSPEMSAEATEETSGVAGGEMQAAGEVQAEPQQQEVWSAFRNLPEFQGQDDRAIAQRLYEAMQREQAASRALQQYQSIIPVASEYLSNREMYEQWKSAQQAPQQQQPQYVPPQAQQPGWWNPPQVKDSHRRYLTRDEQGREIISPDAPLDAKAALQDYMEYRANFAQRFLDNPEQTLGPMVEKVAMERAQEMIDQRFSQMQNESLVSNLEQENKDWLYDANGRVSPEGLAVQKYIQDAKALGINGPQARWDYATRMVERDLLVANMQSMTQPQQAPQPQIPAAQPQQQSAAQRNMEYLRQQAMRQPSQRTVATTDVRVPTKQMTFEERLMASAQQEGLL